MRVSELERLMLAAGAVRTPNTGSWMLDGLHVLRLADAITRQEQRIAMASASMTTPPLGAYPINRIPPMKRASQMTDAELAAELTGTPVSDPEGMAPMDYMEATRLAARASQGE